jgi:hypothetical protein
VTAVVAVLAVLATARLTRLVTRDYLTQRPRRWVQARVPESVAYLLGCEWCSSVWIGAGVAIVTVTYGDGRGVVAVWLALAASHVTGVLTVVDPSDDYGTVAVDEPDGD